MIIGITGSIGTGKTTLSTIIKSISLNDTDLIKFKKTFGATEAPTVKIKTNKGLIQLDNDKWSAHHIKIEVFDNLKEVPNGYYLVLGIFTDAVPRDKLIMKLIDSGDFNASFFFNINSLSYYVYSGKYNIMEEVLYQCKKKEEDELYKNIIIAKSEIDLRE